MRVLACGHVQEACWRRLPARNRGDAAVPGKKATGCGSNRRRDAAATGDGGSVRLQWNGHGFHADEAVARSEEMRSEEMN